MLPIPGWPSVRPTAGLRSALGVVSAFRGLSAFIISPKTWWFSRRATRVLVYQGPCCAIYLLASRGKAWVHLSSTSRSIRLGPSSSSSRSHPGRWGLGLLCLPRQKWPEDSPHFAGDHLSPPSARTRGGRLLLHHLASAGWERPWACMRFSLGHAGGTALPRLSVHHVCIRSTTLMSINQ